jgi:4-hydroxybenzoate polyprenyltransferase
MVLFGSFFAHPALILAIAPESWGLLIASVLVAFWTWQTAVVFDDVSEFREKAKMRAYLAYGELMALTAVLSAIPFGPLPWLLTCLAVYFAVEYPRLRRKHYLLSGLIIGASTSMAFLFGALIPITGQQSSQTVVLVAFLLLAVFTGGSLLKDVGSVEEDERSGIDTIFTELRQNRALPVVATFVAAGCALPALFLNTPLDLVVLTVVAAGAWLLIMKMKEKSYKLILRLYFIEGLWVFMRMIVIHST